MNRGAPVPPGSPPAGPPPSPEPISRPGPVPPVRAVREYVEAALVAVLLALFAKAFVVEAFHIPSASMEGTLLVGDHVVVNKFVYGAHRGPWARLLPYADVARGDVVVFRYPPDPSRDFVKRVVALPGEEVAITRKRLLVDGRAATEPFVRHSDPEVLTGPLVPEVLARRDEVPPLVVPPGSFFALGDNRDDSQDSRFWGEVPLSLLKGRAVLVYWSFDRGAPPGKGRSAAVRAFLDTALHFWERTRWRRTFTLVR